jgi:hypothetical protein
VTRDPFAADRQRAAGFGRVRRVMTTDIASSAKTNRKTALREQDSLGESWKGLVERLATERRDELPDAVTLIDAEFVIWDGSGITLPAVRIPFAAINAWFIVPRGAKQAKGSWFVGASIPIGG